MAYYSSPRKYENATGKDLQLIAVAYIEQGVSKAWLS